MLKTYHFELSSMYISLQTTNTLYPIHLSTRGIPETNGLFSLHMIHIIHTRCTSSCDRLTRVQHSDLAARKVSTWILQRALPSFGKLSGLKSKPTRLKCIRISADNLYPM